MFYVKHIKLTAARIFCLCWSIVIAVAEKALCSNCHCATMLSDGLLAM